jgi:3-hydroxyacyl-[acyl-carrier-protein] dehydratase
MRYLLVDRILEWTPDRSITGIKNITMSEDFLEHHFPRYPVMPGVLILEAMAQLAGWLVAVSSDFESWALLQRVRQGKFYEFALPGDQVRLEVEAVPSEEEGLRAFRGVAKVGETRNAVAEFETRLVPLSDLESPLEYRVLFKVLDRSMVSFAVDRKRARR